MENCGILYLYKNKTGGFCFETGRSIDAPEKAKKLCHILSGHKGAFDLAKGRYIVDGKSIIGVCTMDLSTPLTLTIHEEDDTVLEEIREFVVKAR